MKTLVLILSSLLFSLLASSQTVYPTCGKTKATILSLPDNGTAIIRDAGTSSKTGVPLPFIQKPQAPDLTVPANAILSCAVPQLVLVASSTVANKSFVWSTTSSLPTSNSYSVAVTTNSAAPTQSFIGIYTVTVTDLDNLSTNSATVPVYQNLYPPKAQIASSGSLTCITPTVVLFNTSVSNILTNSLFSVTQGVVGQLWEGPTPTSPATLSSTYPATVPGVYTLTAKDLNNGCTSKQTFFVDDFRDYPAVFSPSFAFVVNCPTKSPVTIFPTTMTSPFLLNINWMLPPTAIVMFSSNGASITTSSPGIYTVTAVSKANGCSTTVNVALYECVGVGEATTNERPLKLFPNPSNGLYSIEIGDAAGELSIEVYNSLGALVKKVQVQATEQVLDIRSERDGMYFIQIMKQQQVVQSIKLLKN